MLLKKTIFHCSYEVFAVSDASARTLRSPKVAHPYLELVQVGGALPVLVVADARHAGEAD